MRNTLFLRATTALGLAALLGGALVTTGPATPAEAATVTISKATYLDKTLAGILGQVGGVVTGYEYKQPTAMTDESCFRPAYGPYSGDAPASCWTPNNYPGYDRVGAPNFAANEVGSDDDYHIDFFNQHILAAHGPDTTAQDIKDEWVAHDVGDWGPGEIANSLMRNQGYLPPVTGTAEYNRHYWLTEAYIENDTLGMVAPGMPATARDLTGKFASVTTEWDSVTWAKFYGTMYSMAYFATDVRDVLSDASATLPRSGWPYQIYQKVQALHEQNATDWRWAQGQLLSFVRNVYGQDNVQAIPDRNNGSLLISILYGNNDYLTTLKIASLIGNDADCTASGVAGLMGIIKGMAGTPQEFKDRIYQNGAGRYINDAVTGFPPYIKNDYPRSQSWDDLASLYRDNAASQILARGGTQDATNFYINAQTVQPEKSVLINNADFEQGTLTGWTAWTPGSDPGTPNVYAEANGTAQSGAWKGTVVTDAQVPEAKLTTSLRGLQTGATYRVSAFIQSDQAARLFAVTPTASAAYTAVVGSYASANNKWVRRSVDFTATASTADVGLHMPTGTAGFAAIDNLDVVQISQPTTTTYEAESATRSGAEVLAGGSASGGSYVGGIDDAGNYVQFTVSVPAAGEYLANLNYANASGGLSNLGMAVNGAAKATIPFARTEAWGQFSQNIASTPVTLAAGSNTIRLSKPATGGGYVQLDSLKVGPAAQPIYAPITAISVANNGFEASSPTQFPASWSTWPGQTGTNADADFTETDAFAGTSRLTHYKAAPYEVYTNQTLAVPNGTYTVSAWAEGSGGQTSTFLSAKSYATSAPELKAAIPTLGSPKWRRITIAGIQVTNGQLTVGMYSSSPANAWSSVDQIEVWRQ